MSFEAWCAVAGALLLGVALSRNLLKDWPLSTAIIYLGLGIILGPLVLNKLHFEPFKHTALLERVTEVAVIISLFSAGLKLRLPFEDGRWKGPLRLALISMTLTIGLVTLVGYYWLGLSPGAAVLLGAFLAPTDPVLASRCPDAPSRRFRRTALFADRRSRLQRWHGVSVCDARFGTFGPARTGRFRLALGCR